MSSQPNPVPSQPVAPTILDYSAGKTRARSLPLLFRIAGGMLNELVIIAFARVRYSWLDLGFEVGSRLLDFRRGWWGPRLLLARAAVIALVAASCVRDVSWYRAMNTAAIVLILYAWFNLLYDFADYTPRDTMWIFVIMCAIRTIHVAFAARV